MAIDRISKRSVDALIREPGKDRTFLWDDALAGFGVAVFASGKKVYVAQYRQAGRSRRITIGEHGRLTPDEARREAKKLLGAVEGGADPIAEHSQPATTARYAHLDADPMRKAADIIGDRISAAMKRTPKTEIVPIKRAWATS